MKIESVLLFFTLMFFCSAMKYPNLRPVCASFGDPCDTDWFTHYCCGEFKCVDYRCQEKDAESILLFAPRGIKCDAVHYCEAGFECQSHRCVPRPDQKLKALVMKRLDALQEQQQTQQQTQQTQ